MNTTTENQIASLKDLAKNANLYLIGDIPKEWRESENFDYYIKRESRQIPEFLESVKDLEVSLYYELKKDTNYEKKVTYYIEHSYILVKSLDSEIMLMLMRNRDGKHYFHPHYSQLHKFSAINHYKKEEVLKPMQEPNYIGVWTENKIKAWVKHCEQKMTLLNGLFEEWKEKNEEIEKEIQDFCETLTACKCTFDKQTYNNITRVNTIHFDCTFEHFKDQNYLSKKVTFKGGTDSILRLENLFNLYSERK